MTDRRAILVVGLAFGDCGKGTIVDYLTRQCSASTVVRFNGGPQAGHNVVTCDGDRSRHHTFSQFGSGSFVPGVRTVLSRFMLIEPYAMFNEAAHLQALGVPDVWGRLLIDGRCPVITPAHQAANRLRELARGTAAHGTCGMGVGETAQDLLAFTDVVPIARELNERTTIARKLRAACGLKADHLHDTIVSLQAEPSARQAIDTLTDRTWIEAAVDNYAELARRATIASERTIDPTLRSPGTVIFEGAQGVLLDESFGFHPHTTWSNTTFTNADALLDESRHDGQRYRLGVLRAYFSRHGPGPLVTEDASLLPRLPEPHNNGAGWQGRFRVGLFDAVAVRYALTVAGGVDGLAVTHMDRLPALSYRLCRAYEELPYGSTISQPPDCFIRDGGSITGIRPHRPADLGYQERLTRRFAQCRPTATQPAGDDAGSFIEALQGELRMPVVLTSGGAVASDKIPVQSAGFSPFPP